MLIDQSYKIRLNFLKVHIEVIHFLASKGEDGYKCIVNNCLNLINEFFNKKTFENKCNDEYTENQRAAGGHR